MSGIIAMDRRQSYKLSLCLILFIFLLFNLSMQNGWAEPPRVAIHIFKYSGLLSEVEEKYFEEFKAIVQTKISSIAEELQSQNSRLDYLAALSPFYVTDQQGEHAVFSGSNADLLDRWKRAHALEILLGRIKSKDNGYAVRSRIFFGDLKTGLDSRFLSVELPIADIEYDTTRDSHSVAILFGLAMYARQHCKPVDEVIALLSAAHERVADIPNNLPGMDELRTAISQELENVQSCEAGQP